MNTKPLFPALLLASALSLLAGSVCAQSASKPLNLKLPNDLPATSSTAAAPASSSSVGKAQASGSIKPPASKTANIQPISTTPGVYYGDTSGHLGNNDVADSQTCDDSKYDKAQVHGAVSTGIASGSRSGTSTYEGGTINVTKAFGDCDHPSGGVSFSISVDQSHFSGGRGGRYGGY